MAGGYAKVTDWILRINISQEGDTNATWIPLLKGFTTLGEARSDNTSEYFYLDGFGAAETGIDSTSRTFSTAGNRVYDEPTQDWLFSFERQWDVSKREVEYQYFNIVTGQGEQGKLSIEHTGTATGSAQDGRAGFGINFAVQGSPAEYNHGTGPWTITYDSGDGTGTITDSTQYESGTKAILKDGNDITPPTGKVFDSWNTRSDGLGAKYILPATIELIDDVTLYAIYRDE